MVEVSDTALAPIGAVQRTRVGREATEPMRAQWIETRTKAGDDGAALFKAAEQLIAKYDQ